MKIAEIKEKAKELGVKVSKLKKGDLIKAIQSAEGNYQCFETEAANDCSQMDCCWRSDCITK